MTVTVTPPPAPPRIIPARFNKCYYKVPGRPDNQCFGGAFGFKELRDYVDNQFSSNPDSYKAYLLIVDAAEWHKRLVTEVAELHNNGVGGAISVTLAKFNRHINQALEDGDWRDPDGRNPDIISRSVLVCIGEHHHPEFSCLKKELFDDPTDPILILSAGNNPVGTPLSTMLRFGFSALSLSIAINDDGKGHYFWVYGLNPTGDDKHDDSSACHELIKDHCIGAPFVVVKSGGTVDAEGVYEQDTPRAGTSFSAPIVAVALKLLKEADPSIANDKLTEIACVTATDLGPTGNDGKYGCGALNLIELFNAAGNWIGTAHIPGIRSSGRPFNTAPVEPNTGFVGSDHLLSAADSKSPGSPFSYAGEMSNSASFCMKFLCTFYSDATRSFQTGLAVNEKKGFAALLFERKDNDFFGGSSSEGSRSDFGDVDYLKGSLGYKEKVGTHDFIFRLDVAKGWAEAKGERVDNLSGTLTRLSLSAERTIGARAHLSFYAAAAEFSGEAGISGAKHNLKHDGFELGVNFIQRFR